MRKLVSVMAAGMMIFGCGDDDPAATTGTGTTGGETGQTTGETTGQTTGETTGQTTGETTGETTGQTTGETTGQTTGEPDVCTPSEKFCNGDKLFTCNAAGSELTDVVCPNGCDQSSKQCKTGCVPNDKVCKEDGKTLVECQPDGEAKETVCTDGCDDGQCVELVCTPDAVVCETSGKKLVKCAPDGLSASTFDICPFGCTEGEADCKEAACEKSETRCAEDEPAFVEVCNEGQTGWDKAKDPCKEECVDGSCKVSACDSGTKQCGPLGVEVCNEAQTGFDLDEPCKNGCLNIDGGAQCALCKDGQVECDGDTVITCNDPLIGFQDTKTCTDLQQCAGGECSEVVKLKGDNTLLENDVLLMKAFAACWDKATAGLCRAIDSSAVSYDTTFDDIKKSWCDNEDVEGFANDFDSPAQFDVVNNIMGNCGTFEIPNEQDVDFEIDFIAKGLEQAACIGYSDSFNLLTNPNSKEVIVKPCELF